MHRMQFVMSTQTYGQRRNEIKLTVNRLSANVVSGLQPLRSLPNAATVTSAVLSIPLATFSVCSVFPSTLRCLCNRQRASSAVKLYGVEATVPLTTERWGLRKWFRSHLWLKNAFDPFSLDTVSYWQERKNAPETLTPVNPKYCEDFFLQSFLFLNILKMHSWNKKMCSKPGQPANITPC